MKNNIFLLLFLILGLFSCQKEEPMVTNISLPSAVTLDIGTSQKITVSHLPNNLQAPSYSWHSSDAAILSVDNNGNIQALKVGEVILTVKAVELNLTATSKITVLPIEASSVKIIPESTSMIIGETIQLQGTILPENTTDKTIVWKSLDENVITVTETGLVEAVGIGKTKISAISGSAIGYSEISVDPVIAEKVSLNKNNISLLVGSTETLEATVEPENATYKDITWSSSDELVATISDGIITAFGVGKTIITATCGNISTSCEVVVNPVRVTGIKLSIESLKIEMSDVAQLSVVVSPENATNKKIIWKSEDSNIAEVDQNGFVTGMNEGTARISASSEDGNFTAYCEVEVSLKGLTLSNNYYQMLTGTWDLIWVQYSTNENAYLNAAWTSSNPSVATVTGGGKDTNSATIEAKDLGVATITATSVDGTKQVSATVEVVDITHFIELSFITYSIVNLNGFIHGDIYSRITNNSSYPIEIMSFYCYDGYTGKLIARQDPTEVTQLTSGESTNLGTKFNSVYYPIFKWNIKWNGKEYSIEHQYSSSFRSVNNINEKLFKIENTLE